LHAVRDPNDVPAARERGKLGGEHLDLVEGLLGLVLLSHVHRPSMAGRFHGLVKNRGHVVRPSGVGGGLRSDGMNGN